MQITIDFPDNLFLYFNLLRILNHSGIKIGKVVMLQGPIQLYTCLIYDD